MRAGEFTPPGPNDSRTVTLTIGPVKVKIDGHAVDRAIFRGVNPYSVDKVLRKLPSIADELGTIELGWKSWIYDPELRVALGMRRIGSKDLTFSLKTVWRNRPMDYDVAKIIEV